ncbi:DUF2523 family protein [Azonexus sp.]|uniref:DUF2523 family protein n=1 Tax=Azonexus sp. TaxID=1872668 RepID=UPI0035AF9C8B
MMGGAGTWLMALVGPLARQVLLSLGIGVVTFVGLDTAVTAALSAAKAATSSISADVAAILAMGGVFTAMSIIAGGITAGVSMIALKRFTKI